jgi:integrase
MPYRRSDSLVWWVSFIGPGGERVRRSTGTTDRKEAGALEAKWKLETYRVRQWDAEPTRTFEELMVAYLQATQAEKRSAERDRWIVRRLRPHFVGRTLDSLRAADVRSYIERRRTDGAKPSTINRELALLSAALNYARRQWEWEVPNPVPGRKLREGEGRVRWLTREQANWLVEAAAAQPRARHLPDFIRLAVNTGCRRNELLGLEWSRVDLRANLLYLEGVHTKNGRRRSIPLNQAARQALLNRARFRATHCPTSPWVFCTRRGERVAEVKRSFASACRRAGIEDFRIHDLRHTCAAWLVSAGVPLAEVRDLLGHASVTMTERYAHLAPDNVRAAVAVLDQVQSRFGHSGPQGDREESRK